MNSTLKGLEDKDRFVRAAEIDDDVAEIGDDDQDDDDDAGDGPEDGDPPPPGESTMVKKDDKKPKILHYLEGEGGKPNDGVIYLNDIGEKVSKDRQDGKTISSR